MVLTGRGLFTVYNSATFETRHMLRHEEEISAMTFSHSSRLLVTYGYRTTDVWSVESVESGEVMHRIQNPIGSMVSTILFTAGDSQIVIGSADRHLRLVP